MRERFAIIIRGGDGAEMPHMKFMAELYPSGEWGFGLGELDDSGTKFKRDGFQSKVFLYDNREECLVDMAHRVKNFILFNAGLPEEDAAADDPTSESAKKDERLALPSYVRDLHQSPAFSRLATDVPASKSSRKERCSVFPATTKSIAAGSATRGGRMKVAAIIWQTASSTSAAALPSTWVAEN